LALIFHESREKESSTLDSQCEDTKNSIKEICRVIAENHKPVAACLYGPVVSGYADEKIGVNILLILSAFKPILKTYRKRLEKKDVYILTIDQWFFQKDIEKGWLGEFAAEKLIVPYDPIINSEYLWQQEVTLKKRLCWELLEAIVLEFPELSHELVIKPEFFIYETLMQRAQLFAPLTYRFLNILEKDLKEKNVEIMMKGYRKALEDLRAENLLTFSNEQVKITSKLIKIDKARGLRIPDQIKSIRRAAWLNLLSVLPKMMSSLAYDQEFYMKTHQKTRSESLRSKLKDPKNYLLMPTPLGLVPLSDKTTIEEFVKRTFPGTCTSEVASKEIGGVLNSVYLLTILKNHEQQRIVVKKFKNWVSFKWFPLALWAIGTKSFAVLGQSRLEREYSLNKFLQSQGLAVPKILHISPRESLIFQEFVEGETLVSVIKRVIKKTEKANNELQLMKEAGKRIAEVHKTGVVLGDCKPENLILAKDGKIYFVDLEQASRDGNQIWDVAEFLYYSGHYVPPLASASLAELIAKPFIEGYLEAGGKKENIRKAASPRYTKVFSIFTQPHIIFAISNLCRKIK
jgi:tRNA A-37 threonylcarbamoyl transferase component Bud32